MIETILSIVGLSILLLMIAGLVEAAHRGIFRDGGDNGGADDGSDDRSYRSRYPVHGGRHRRSDW